MEPTVTITLEEYEFLKDIKENLGQYRIEMEKRKYGVIIKEKLDYRCPQITTYMTDDEFIAEKLKELKEAKEKIKELSNQLEELNYQKTIKPWKLNRIKKSLIGRIFFK